MNLEEAKRLSNVKVITAAYLLAGLTGQQELNPSRWPALVSNFIDEIKKRTGADWLSMPKGAYEKGDSVSRESITQSEFLQLLADYPVQSATAHPQAAAPAPVADSASDAPDTSKGTPPKLTEVDKVEIQRLYNRGRGASVNAMAKQFNVSRPTIEKVLQRAGIKK